MKARSRLLITLLGLATVLHVWRPVYGQSFSSGSTGSDGSLDLSWVDQPPSSQYFTDVIFDPASYGPAGSKRALDANGDNVFHFTTIRIPSHVRVVLRAPEHNWVPVYWLAQGEVVIDGRVDLSGEDGHSGTSVGVGRYAALPGPGGFAGGLGSSSLNFATGGFGPGGGRVTNQVTYGSGGSHSSNGEGNNPGATYGSPFLLPLVGGSGGAGGGENDAVSTQNYGGGGGGGGAIVIASASTIRINGSIRARGGAGGNSPSYNGAGGSGGAIRLLAPDVVIADYSGSRDGLGFLSVSGGDGYNDGGDGRIRIEALRPRIGARSLFPDNAASVRVGSLAPNTPFKPGDPGVPAWPSVRLTKINNLAVPSKPSGSFEMPDVTAALPNAVPVEIVTTNVPLNADLKLWIVSPETPGLTQVSITGPAQGSVASATRTGTATFPRNISRGYLQATWVP